MARDTECHNASCFGVVVVAASFLLSVLSYTHFWMPTAPQVFFRLHVPPNSTVTKPRDELGIALKRASNENKTLIISILNEAYAEEGGLLDLFLRSLQEGEDTKFLIRHVLFVAVDKTAFRRCRILGLHCYQLVTEGVDFSEEVIFMSKDFVKMMWRRTLFLGDVVRHGYSFIFTDMDVIWLRNPFTKLSNDGEDMQISCDQYNGHPFNPSNPINTGFYFVKSNNKTTALFEEWYKKRQNATGMKEQDVLSQMKIDGTFKRLGLKVRFLDTLYFSGFCQDSRDFREVRTVHANCCRIVKAKLADLTTALEIWKRYNGTQNGVWPAHSSCHEAWEKDASKFELQKTLESASMQNKTLIISVLNRAYAEEKGMLDLFLQNLHQSVDTEFLIKHIVFVAVDQIAFSRCKQLKLHCYRLVTSGVDFSKEELFMTKDFKQMMWQRIRFLGDVLKLGYNFILTDMDVMWLRNPLSKLTHNGEDMQISCDKYNRKPFDEGNTMNTGFYYVVSNKKTTALFDEWYALRSRSQHKTEQDMLNMMKFNGTFRQLGMKVKFLDTLYFSGFCQDSRNLREVITLHANCCRSLNAKLADLTAALDTWKSFNDDATTSVNWTQHRACLQSWRVNKTT